MTDEGYFLVTRLRKNAVVRVLERLSLPEDSSVLSDEMIVMFLAFNLCLFWQYVNKEIMY